MTDRNEIRKSGWGKGIFVIYGAFVVLILAMVAYVSSHDFDLVEPDYYEKELAYQQQLDRIKRAEALPLPLTWRYDRGEQIVIIRFPKDNSASTVSGTIRLFRPSDASLDLVHSIEADSVGVQLLDVSQLAGGLWKMQIDWTSGALQYYKEESVVIE